MKKLGSLAWFGIALPAAIAVSYWCGRCSSRPCAAEGQEMPVAEQSVAEQSAEKSAETNLVEAAADSRKTYRVKAGEDLYMVAIMNSVTASELKAANGLESDVLTPGQELVIPEHVEKPSEDAAPEETPAPAAQVAKPQPAKKAEPGPAVEGISWDEWDGEVTVNFNFRPDIAKARDFIRFEPAVKDFSVQGMYWDNSRMVVRINDDSVRGTNIVFMLAAGMPDAKGRTLGKEHRREFHFNDALPSVSFASDGRYLAPLGACAVGVECMNAKEIEYSLARVPAHNIVQLLAREERNYGSWYGSVDDDDTLELAQKAVTGKLAVNSSHNEKKVVPVPIRDAEGKVVCGTYLLSVAIADKLPEDACWEERRSRRPTYRLVCTTDIGVSARHADGWIYAWTTSLATGYPESGIKVEVFASNGDVIASDVSGVDGLAACELPKESEPFAVVASREDGSDCAFLALSSRMEVDERHLSGYRREYIESEENEAYVWTDRGIYRHGEPIMVQAIVRNGAGDAPKPFPLTLRLKDPKGREQAKVTGVVDEFGRFTADAFSVPESMMSGKWWIEATVPGGKDDENIELGSTSIRVEEFVPPKVRVAIPEMPENCVLAMKCDGNNCATAEPMAFNVKVSGEHLFGGPAAGLFADVAYSFEDAPFAPDGWRGWNFGDSSRKVAPNFETVEGVQLDENGVAEFNIKPDCMLTPSAAVKLTVQGSVRESGGRPATVRKSSILHVRQFYIGSTLGDSVPRTDGGAKRKVALVRFDGSRLAEKKRLDVKFERIENNYTCVRDDDGFYTWKCEKLQYPLSKSTVETDENGEAEIVCPADGWGEIAATVSDPATGASFGTTYWVEWSSGGDDVLRAPMRDPTALSVAADKKVYRPGDTPVLTVKSPFAGRAWITGMRKGVVINKVVTLTNLTSVVQLDAIEEDWAPGADVAVTVVQAVKSGAKHRASRARGIASLKITPADRILDVKVESSSEYVPGAGSKLKAEITVVGEVEPGSVATVTAVDEGINLFTGQEVPDPAGWFAETRSASHPLYDIYNRLLPVMDDPLKANGAKTGGGADAGMFARVSPVPTRRFKPLSKWLRDVKLEDGKANVEFELGEFTGEIRVTAVAANKTGTGAGATHQKVSPKLVAQPDAPRFAAPGDTVTLTYTLNNRGGEACTAEYAISAAGTNLAGKVELANDASTTIEFPVKIGNAVGEEKISYVVKAFGEEHAEEILLPVRPAVAWEKTGETVILNPGDERVFELPQNDQFRDIAERTFTVSGSPLSELVSAFSYLAHYPYGCLEQTTSQVFPLVAAGGILNKLDVERTTLAYDAEDAVRNGIARVVSMIRYDGFAMWPDSTVEAWNNGVPLYASQFLVEAAKAGFDVPQDAIASVKRFCRDWMNEGGKLNGDDGKWGRTAYAALVLAIAGTPDKAAMYDKLDVRDSMSDTTKCRLARAFVLAGDRAAAAKLLADVKPAGNATQLSEAIMALCEYNASDPRLPGFVAALLRKRDPKRGHWLTTGENARSLMALGTYYRITGIGGGKPEAVLIGGGKELKLEDGKRKAVKGGETVKVANRGTGPMYLAVETRRLPDQSNAPAYSNGMSLALEVRRPGGKQEAVDPSTLKRGDNALIAVKLTPSGARSVADYVIDMPLPACFEPGDASNFAQASKEYELRREARDDRVVIFTRPYEAKAGETLEFFVPVSVVTSGEFAFPGATAEAMYIPEVNARSASARITIVK